MELYDIEMDHWQFTTALPKPLHGGSVTVVNNRLFYFGGEDIYKEVSNSAYEYIPKPAGQEYSDKGSALLSYWEESPNLDLNSHFLVAIGYEL